MSKLIAFLLIPECGACESCTCTTDNLPEIFRKEFAEIRPWAEYTPHQNHRLVVWLGDGKNKKQQPDKEMKKLLGDNTSDSVEYFCQCSVCQKLISMQAYPHDHDNDEFWNLDNCECPGTWSHPKQVP